MSAIDAGRATRDLRRFVVFSSVAFALLLSALAWALARLRHAPLAGLLEPSPLRAVAMGAAIGVAAGAICILVVSRARALAPLRRLARDAIEGIEPRWFDLVVVSLAAGWGEELFFRGALQPLAGVWLTSAAFVLLHGATRYRSRGGAAFAVFLYAASSGLGFLANGAGLAAAMAAHAAYDLTVLVGIRRTPARAHESLTGGAGVPDAGCVAESPGPVDADTESQGGNEA